MFLFDDDENDVLSDEDKAALAAEERGEKRARSNAVSFLAGEGDPMRKKKVLVERYAILADPPPEQPEVGSLPSVSGPSRRR